ncbi:MAG: AAA family ATPase [Treponema sp.]|nr:AAA family ATPase [Treponema sp.]MBD5443403.1 AAA family ATPase [Treponema sp.]
MNKISKIKSIRNMAIFKDFEWDNVVKDKNEKIQTFKDINIIYGRNYSGKTTLSRIFRAFETGILSDKYVNSEFQLSFEGNTKLTQNEIDQKQDFRVFNSDFIDENLSFIHNENGMIEPFAILGEDNQKISQEIKSIQEELGIDSEDEKTGLYKKLYDKKQEYTNAESSYNMKSNKLNINLTEKARKIKNEDVGFPIPDYNINKLKHDIDEVLKSSFVQKSNQELDSLKKTLNEEEKSRINIISFSSKFSDLKNKTKGLLEKKVDSADKIKELVESALLNSWVEKGIPLHEGRRTCAFCGQPITEERISQLQKHFDKEMEVFQKDLESELNKINAERESLENIYKNQNKTFFYATLQPETETAIDNLKQTASKYIESLEELSKQIKDKKQNVFRSVEFIEPYDYTQSLKDSIMKYNECVNNSNTFGQSLKEKKEDAKRILLLNAIKQYSDDSKYLDSVASIVEAEKDKEIKKTEFEELQKLVNQKENTLKEKKRALNDEEKGANKVNEYLSNFFGYDFLKLVAQKEMSEREDTKHYIFEIQRNGEKAYNLSEGECRLVAFAYFMAKLNDVDTKEKKPLIWIDDPICSLDANHVFFVYSLIYSEIAKKDIYSQLFVSTHNLDFLKYLKMLSKKEEFRQENIDKYRMFFLLERRGEESRLILMPEYIKNYVTEFNYLFNEIYKCSKIDNPSDENYPSVYNFGNNARKFLEIYLFYKFPDSEGKKQKMIKFFGSESDIPRFINSRITNEYSHLEEGGIERATIPIEVSEFKKDAQLILDRIKILDKEQYESLLKSIGETNTDAGKQSPDCGFSHKPKETAYNVHAAV